ncbi:hypothetical protein [Nocardia arthritidis]|nr:hypothetical protein [Nocardia arthritidis]
MPFVRAGRADPPRPPTMTMTWRHVVVMAAELPEVEEATWS